MSKLQSLWAAWRKAGGKVKAGEKLGWPPSTMQLLRDEERAAWRALHDEELRLATDPTARLVW